MHHLLRAACLLALALACAGGLAAAQTDFFETKYTFSTGEKLEFLAGSASLKYYPAPSANCTKCFVAFKLGALSELDAFGQPIPTHVIPSIADLTPAVTTGKRVSGDSEYEYITMTFSGDSLGTGLTKEACPSLESILSRAQQMGIQAPAGSLMSGVTGLSSLSPRQAPKLSVESGLLPSSLALAGADGASALQALLLQASAGLYSGRRLSQAEAEADEVLLLEAARAAAAPKPAPAPVAAPTPPKPAPVPAPPAKPVEPMRLPVVVAPPPAPAPAALPVASLLPLSRQLPAQQQMLVDPNARGVPSLRITFMFGFTANKTFPYGLGRTVSAPQGSIKWSLEANNWPFCSLYNTLKLELVAMSTVRENDAQFTFNANTETELLDGEQEEEEVMMEGGLQAVQEAGYFSGNSRRLTQYGSYNNEFFEPESAEVTKRAAVGLPALPSLAGLAALHGLQLPAEFDPLAALSMLGSRSRKPLKLTSTAKLLVGPGLAAALEMPTYSFTSSNFTGESNVSIVLAHKPLNGSDGAARFSLTFGYFPTSLFYDPTLYFSNTYDMELTAADVSTIPGASSSGVTLAAASCPPGDTQCGRGRRGRATTSAAEASGPGLAVRLAQMLVAAAVMLLLS
ncbi:hypothetical protein OEZ86_000111 [Tetradesmus obliquus]|nr:hypothetical protein OEZ86_000111 [Tetradesmus obliquus]